MATHLDEVYEQGDATPSSIRLKGDEHLILPVEGAGLVEPRATGHYGGGSAGASVRVAKGVRFRVGQHRGTYVRGPEEQKLIAEGDLFITTNRVVFTSDTHNREWNFDKTLNVIHDDALGVTYVNVTVWGVPVGSGGAPPLVSGKLMLDLSYLELSRPAVLAPLWAFR